MSSRYSTSASIIKRIAIHDDDDGRPRGVECLALKRKRPTYYYCIRTTRSARVSPAVDRHSRYPLTRLLYRVVSSRYRLPPPPLPTGCTLRIFFISVRVVLRPRIAFHFRPKHACTRTHVRHRFYFFALRLCTNVTEKSHYVSSVL